MAEMDKEQFYCAFCKRPVTRRDLDKGAAVERFGEILCIEHFNELYPDECISHPGQKVTTQCDYCGRWACDNCFIEIDGKKVCSRCKPAVIGEFITGRQARPIVEARPPFKKPDKETVENLYQHRHKWREQTMTDFDKSCGASCFRMAFLLFLGLVLLIILGMLLNGC